MIYRCASWKNKMGQTITAVSTCLPDKTWSLPISFPSGPLFYPPAIARPDGPDMQCQTGCKPLNLTYNPNTEPGAEFQCKNPLDWESMPVKVEPSNQCYLLCDKMLVMVTECMEGLWTGNPGLGFWCSHERDGVGEWIKQGIKVKEIF